MKDSNNQPNNNMILSKKMAEQLLKSYTKASVNLDVKGKYNLYDKIENSHIKELFYDKIIKPLERQLPIENTFSKNKNLKSSQTNIKLQDTKTVLNKNLITGNNLSQNKLFMFSEFTDPFEEVERVVFCPQNLEIIKYEDILNNIKHLNKKHQEKLRIINKRLSKGIYSNGADAIERHQHIIEYDELNFRLKQYKSVVKFEDLILSVYAYNEEQKLKILNRINQQRVKKIFNQILIADKTRKEKPVTMRPKDEIDSFNIREYLNSLNEEQNVKNVEKSDSFDLDWDYVSFFDGGFYVNSYKPPYHVNNFIDFTRRKFEDSRCNSSFNLIIKYLKEKIPHVPCFVSVNGILKIQDQDVLERAILFFKKTKKSLIFDLQERDKNGDLFDAKNYKDAISRIEIMSEEDFKRFKNQFVEYLLKNQLKQYKIAPCKEYILYKNFESKEDSFIFTLPTDNENKLLIIFENLQKHRGSKIFLVKQPFYYNVITAIYNYFTSDAYNKRRKLQNKEESLNLLGIEKKYTLKHTTIKDWILQINKISKMSSKSISLS